VRRRAAPPARALREIRRSCLALPGVEEVVAWKHPNFRVGKKTFAAFEIVRGRPSLAVKVEKGFRELLVDESRWFRTPYGGTRWVSAWLDAEVDWALLHDLLKRAHREVAPDPAPAAGGARPSAPPRAPNREPVRRTRRR
jgi:predicted DNA-binding protein (MmcQ/YjbR family)